MTWARDSSCTELVPYWELDMLTNAESVAVLSHHIWITSSYRLIEKIMDVFGGTRGNTQRRLTFQTHHMMRPVMMATQVTQQVSGLLLSSSMSLQQQHRQIRCTVRTSRLRTRPTAPTHARNISDWGRERERRQKSGKAFYFEEQVHLNQRCSTSHPQISAAAAVWSEAVRLADPAARKLDSTEWKQPTGIKPHSCVKICAAGPLISIITADCCKGDRKQSGGWFGVTRSPPPRRESRFLQDCERLRGGKKNRNDLKLWEGSIMWHAGFHSVLWFLSVEKYLKPEGWREETAIRRRRLKNTACGLLHQKSPRMYFIFSHQPLSPHRKEIHSWQRPVCSEADKYGIKFIYIRLKSCLFSYSLSVLLSKRSLL